MKTVAVDLDGTLAQYDGWKGVDHFGPPIDGAREFLRGLQDMGVRILIYTTRTNFSVNGGNLTVLHLVDLVERYLQEHDLPFDEVYAGEGKPLCAAIVDDRAVSCRVQDNPAAYQLALRDVKALVK